MTEELIKRYLLEKIYEDGLSYRIHVFGEIQYVNLLYEDLKNGKITINENDFFEWLKTLKRNKRNFGAYLSAKGYIDENVTINELTEDQSVDLSIKNPKNLIISQA